MLDDMTVRGLRAQIKSDCFEWEKMTKEEIEEVGSMLADMYDLERDFKQHHMRMYFHILGSKPYYKEVSSVEEAKVVIDAISDFVNTKVDEGVFSDHCSTAGLEEYDEEEKDWVTWYDDNGLDFNEYFRTEGEE